MINFIIDIDGTALSGNREINSSKQFIEYLQNTEFEFLFATNSIKAPTLQAERFDRIGIHITPKKIYTPIDSINKYLNDNGIQKAFIVGSAAEIPQVAAEQSTDSPDVVVLLDFEKENYSYRDLQKIIHLVERGVEIVSASGSTFYLNNGKKQIDTGAFVHLIESVTHHPIPILGKPSDEYFTNARSGFLCAQAETIVIGDDWKTDITGAKNAGFRSVLVRSCKYRKGDEKQGNPDYVVNNLMEVLSLVA